jgi:hypothetical protein
MRGLSFLGGILLAACSEPSVLLIDHPPIDASEHKAWILALESATDTQLFAYPLPGEPSAIRLSAPPGLNALEAIALDQDLAGLHLTEGPLPLFTPTSTGTSRTLSDLGYSAVFEAAIQNRRAGRWTLVPKVSSALAPLALPDPLPRPKCPVFKIVESITVDTPTQFTAGVALDPSRAILASYTGQLFSLSKSGAAPTVTSSISLSAPLVDPALPTEAAWSAVLAGPREILMASQRSLLHLRLDDPLTRAEVEVIIPALVSSRHRILLANPTPGRIGPSLFVMMSWGELQRIDLATRTATTLFTFPSTVTDFAGEIATISEDELYAVENNFDRVVHVSGAAVSEETPSAQILAYAGVTRAASGEVFACGAHGELLRRNADASWTLLGDTGLAIGVCNLSPFRDGVVFAGDQGYLGGYAPSTGICSAKSIATGTIDILLPFGDGLLAAGDEVAGATNPVVTIIAAE